MTNIEKVARAIYEADDPWHKAWPWPDLQSDQAGVDQYRRIAEAAIAAMQPAPQEPVADAWRKFELWLFRDCNEGTRRHLWSIFELPVDEITNHGRERQALRLVKQALTPLYAGPTPPNGGSDAE